jgi:hypothetical protein
MRCEDTATPIKLVVPLLHLSIYMKQEQLDWFQY